MYFLFKYIIAYIFLALSSPYVDYVASYCDGTVSISIVCPIGQTILITNAWYGRWDTATYACSGCRNDIPCYFPVYQYWAHMCNYQNSCSGIASAPMDPCGGTYKYGVVNYVCQ